MPEILKVRTVTAGADSAGAAAAGTDGGDAAKSGSGGATSAGAGEGADAAKAGDVGSAKAGAGATVLRGLRLPRGETRPALVYFHWPHEDGDRGRDIQKFCGGALEDEEFARVSHLFYCVEVNTRDTADAIVREAGVKETPSILLCDGDGTILWRTSDRTLSGKGLAAALKAALKKHLPERWKAVEVEMDRQREAVRRATELLRGADGAEDALWELNGAVRSDVRFGAGYDAALKLLREVERARVEAEERGRK